MTAEHVLDPGAGPQPAIAATKTTPRKPMAIALLVLGDDTGRRRRAAVARRR